MRWARRMALVGCAAPVLALGVVAVRPAAAQVCRGLPARTGYLAAFRNQDGTHTAGAGVRVSPLTLLAGNVALPENPPNGSRLVSYGGRVAYGGERDGLAACVITGVQVGYAHLINAEGLRMNAQLTTVSIPAAFALGATANLAPGTRLVLFAIPQFIFRSRRITLLSRDDTVSVSESPTESGLELGGALLLGPLVAHAAYARSGDGPWQWQVGVGVAR